MPFTVSPTLLENDNVEITTNANGDLAIRSKSNGNTLTIDEDVALSTGFDQVSLDSKADQDGGGTATLDNYALVDTEEARTKQVTYERDPESDVTGLSLGDYAGGFASSDYGLRISPVFDRELRITEFTIETDESGDFAFGVWEFDDTNGRGVQLDSSTVTLSTGVQTVEVDLLIPGEGDYFLGSESAISMRRFNDVASEFPVEGDLLTIVEGASPEGFVGPRSNYYYYFDIGVEEANPETAAVSLNVDNAVEFERMAANVQNGVYYAAPGDLKTVLDSCSPGDTVHLYPETYTTIEEVTVPRGVRLIGNGARVEPNGDHNVFFLEPDCHIKNLTIGVGHLNFTSKAIEINTERMGDSYHGGGGGTVIYDVNIRGSIDNLTGDGVYIRVGADQWYSANQHHQFNVSGMGNGLHADVDAQGHANANIFKCSLWNNATQLRHSGNGPFESQIIGELDASDSGAGTDHMIVNDPSTERTCVVYGKMYDPFNCSGDYLIGWINMVHHNRPHVTVAPNSPNAQGLITSQDRDELLVLDLHHGITWRREYYSGSPWLRFQVDTDGGRNFSDIMSFRMDTGQVRMSRELVTNDLWPTNGINLGGGASIGTNANGEVVITNRNGVTTTF